MALHLPERDPNSGLVLIPQPLDAKPVMPWEIPEGMQLPDKPARHHILRPRKFIEHHPVYGKLRAHPINAPFLEIVPHQRDHVDYDPALAKDPLALVREISPRTVTDFLEEAQVYDQLALRVGTIWGIARALREDLGASAEDTQRRQRSMHALEEALPDFVGATEDTEVVPPALMQFAVDSLLKKIGFVQPVTAQ